MRKVKIVGALGLAAVFMSGCATSPLSQRQKTLNQAPKWYQSVPRDKDYLLTTGAAESPKMELAVELASATARGEVARNVDLYVKTQIASASEQSGRATASEDLAVVTSEAVSKILNEVSVSIARSRIRERKIVASSGGYYAWVMIEVPSKEVDKAIYDYALERVKTESDERVKSILQKLTERSPR